MRGHIFRIEWELGVESHIVVYALSLWHAKKGIGEEYPALKATQIVFIDTINKVLYNHA